MYNEGCKDNVLDLWQFSSEGYDITIHYVTCMSPRSL